MLAGDAYACACVAAPLEERLDDADAAFVGHVVSERTRDLRGAKQLVLTVAVDQRVKGTVEDPVEVVSPSGSDCDLLLERNESVGLLLTRSPEGDWLGTICGVVEPEELVTVGGEPRGGVIKVVLGVAILALVLSWALRRKARGIRPRLPGAPEP